MKKSIIKLLYCTLPLWGLCGCSDFLNEEPQSDFTQVGTKSEESKSEYLSIADAQAQLQGAYNSFKNDIFQLENYMVNDVQSDNCYAGADGVQDIAEDMLNLTAMNYKVELVWSQYLSMAGSATNVIENAKLMKVQGEDENERNRIIAEAKFIRAWAFFDMVRLWGDLPMVLQLIPTITSENLDKWYPVMYPTRTPEADVYKQIISDLDETNTIAYLVSKNKGAFQATKGAAYGLLAKVYATIGKKKDRDYTKVVELCNKAIGEGYELVDDFDSLWNPDNKFTSESIFEVLYSTDSPNWAFWTLLKEEDGTVTWRRYCTPTHDLLNKFDKEKDVRYSSSIIWKQAPYDTYYPSDNYPFSYKIREKNSDIILMRLADIMLLKAEALVELNEVGPAIDIVNRIRERAGLGVESLKRNMSQEDARLAVENERQLELYMEAQRWYDLLRNERTLDVMKKHKNEKGEAIFSNLPSFRTKWPVPQSEMDKNANLVQNDGY